MELNNAQMHTAVGPSVAETGFMDGQLKLATNSGKNPLSPDSENKAVEPGLGGINDWEELPLWALTREQDQSAHAAEGQQNDCGMGVVAVLEGIEGSEDPKKPEGQLPVQTSPVELRLVPGTITERIAYLYQNHPMNLLDATVEHFCLRYPSRSARWRDTGLQGLLRDAIQAVSTDWFDCVTRASNAENLHNAASITLDAEQTQRMLQIVFDNEKRDGIDWGKQGRRVKLEFITVLRHLAFASNAIFSTTVSVMAPRLRLARTPTITTPPELLQRAAAAALQQYIVAVWTAEVVNVKETWTFERRALYTIMYAIFCAGVLDPELIIELLKLSYDKLPRQPDVLQSDLRCRIVLKTDRREYAVSAALEAMLRSTLAIEKARPLYPPHKKGQKARLNALGKDVKAALGAMPFKYWPAGVKTVMDDTTTFSRLLGLAGVGYVQCLTPELLHHARGNNPSSGYPMCLLAGDRTAENENTAESSTKPRAKGQAGQSGAAYIEVIDNGTVAWLDNAEDRWIRDCLHAHRQDKDFTLVHPALHAARHEKESSGNKLSWVTRTLFALAEEACSPMQVNPPERLLNFTSVESLYRFMAGLSTPLYVGAGDIELQVHDGASALNVMLGCVEDCATDASKQTFVERLQIFVPWAQARGHLPTFETEELWSEVDLSSGLAPHTFGQDEERTQDGEADSSLVTTPSMRPAHAGKASGTASKKRDGLLGPARVRRSYLSAAWFKTWFDEVFNAGVFPDTQPSETQTERQWLQTQFPMMAAICRFVGLRISEVANLRCSDLWFPKNGAPGTISVRASEFYRLKSTQAVRRVTLAWVPPALLDHLRSLHSTRLASRGLKGFLFAHPDTPDQMPTSSIASEEISSSLRRFCTHHQLMTDTQGTITAHGLRHSFANDVDLAMWVSHHQKPEILLGTVFQESFFDAMLVKNTLPALIRNKNGKLCNQSSVLDEACQHSLESEAIIMKAMQSRADAFCQALLGRHFGDEAHAISRAYHMGKLLGHLSPSTTFHSYLHTMDRKLSCLIEAHEQTQQWTCHFYRLMMGGLSETGLEKKMKYLDRWPAADVGGEWKMGKVLGYLRAGYDGYCSLKTRAVESKASENQ